MNRHQLLSGMWIIEVIVGLLPATIMLLVGLVSYFVFLTMLPKLLFQPNSAWVGTFLVLTGMIVGGGLGLTGIILAFEPDRLRPRPRLKLFAIMLGCAGILVEGLYVWQEGLRTVASDMLSMWIILGPLIVGFHCLYRVFRANR